MKRFNLCLLNFLQVLITCSIIWNVNFATIKDFHAHFEYGRILLTLFCKDVQTRIKWLENSFSYSQTSSTTINASCQYFLLRKIATMQVNEQTRAERKLLCVFFCICQKRTSKREWVYMRMETERSNRIKLSERSSSRIGKIPTETKKIRPKRMYMAISY